MILACQNISKSFGIVPVLKEVSFHVNEREKVAIVGINGAGKSTLFKIIIGELPADEGQVIRSGDITIGYLSQQQGLDADNTIYTEVLSVKQPVLDMEAAIRHLETEMKTAKGDELEKMLSSYTRLTHEFEFANGYACRSEATGVLKGLGFMEPEFEKPIQTLSGGQKTRVALAKLLLSRPDMILLDEPTNHLDMESIAWLENFLSGYTGAVVVIAHDRYFLDKIITKVVELDNTKAQVFQGNYSNYAEKKAVLREVEWKHYLTQQQEIKHQEAVITKLRSFNREKSIKRAESREKMLHKIEKIDRPVEVRSEMNIQLSPNLISGNDVLMVSGLSKAFGNNQLFSDLSFEMKRGEKAAVIGNNGAGKTTLLKIINGLLAPDQGEVRLGAKVYIGYYDQAHQLLDMDKTIFEEIQTAYPKMDNTKVRNALAAFLFTGDDVFKRIQDISGGERGRVSLAKLMLSDANLLILDEPTNHLDMVSKEILEQAINSYAGTVLYVSHDRYFINKTATRILDLADHALNNYYGDYNYYLEKKLPPKTDLQEEADKGGPDNKTDWEQKKRDQAATRKRQNDLAKIEDEIHLLEQRSMELDASLLDETVCSDPDQLIKIHNEKTEIENRLNELLEKWELLACET